VAPFAPTLTFTFVATGASFDGNGAAPARIGLMAAAAVDTAAGVRADRPGLELRISQVNFGMIALIPVDASRLGLFSAGSQLASG
jgi:hypothetical protein